MKKKELTEREKLDNFINVLNQVPPDRYIKQNKYAGNSNYLPIDYLEMELDRIFLGLYNRKVEKIEVLGTSVNCVIRLELTHPVTNQIIVRDGEGSVNFADKQGQVSAKALEKAYPMAEAYAFKNACATLGKRFGRDLNRGLNIGFSSFYQKK